MMMMIFPFCYFQILSWVNYSFWTRICNVLIQPFPLNKYKFHTHSYR